jgi:hypothetical protein
MDGETGTDRALEKKIDWRAWIARVFIGLVIAWNLQAALIFWIAPVAYAVGFELGGVPGSVAVRGFAVLFVMWNIPYLLACWSPRRNGLSLMEAIVMQLIGVAGEYVILSSLGADHAVLRASLVRFVLFDSTGLGLLAIAFVLTKI